MDEVYRISAYYLIRLKIITETNKGDGQMGKSDNVDVDAIKNMLKQTAEAYVARYCFNLSPVADN